ncbi:MAG: DUF5329 domain-containing protein [Burkholderiaceae bacterium]|nr:DUF5329 domain-containing protein [Burkholderiaceae bacterium]
MKTYLLAAPILAAFWTAASAAPTAAPVRAEIDTLLNKLQSSGCQFNRNGSWYSGAEAKSHLLRKLEYFEDKGTVKNTEQFIELAATKSSSSGKPYQVKCGADHALDSKLWLTRELATQRKTTP